MNGYVKTLQDIEVRHGRVRNFGSVVTEDLNPRRYIGDTRISVHNFVFKSHLIFGSPNNMEGIDYASINYNLRMWRLVQVNNFLAIQETTNIYMKLEGIR